MLLYHTNIEYIDFITFDVEYKCQLIDCVKTTSVKNESTEVLCRKQSTVWDMQIR